MPSPLGHALAGAAVGWAIAGPPGPHSNETPRPLRRFWRNGGWFALCATIPDLDLLFGAHSGPTHGLGAALAAGAVIAALTRRPRFALAAAAAYASHTLLDWLGSDTSPPIGIMALWPIGQAYYQSDLHVFDAISRRYASPGFWSQNLRAVVRELLILLPPLTIVAAVRLRGRSSREPSRTR